MLTMSCDHISQDRNKTRLNVGIILLLRAMKVAIRGELTYNLRIYSDTLRAELECLH